MVLPFTGSEAAREEAVEDLIKRRNRAIAKLEAAARPESRVRLERPNTAVVSATPSGGSPGTTGQDAEVEVLVCQECNRLFERMRVRGRKPTLCPACRTVAKA